MFFIAKKQQKTVLDFSLDSLIIKKYNKNNKIIQKILNLLNEVSDSKFASRKWNIINDQPNANYEVRNKIIRDLSKQFLCLVDGTKNSIF